MPFKFFQSVMFVCLLQEITVHLVQNSERNACLRAPVCKTEAMLGQMSANDEI